MQIYPTFSPNIGVVKNYVQLLADYLKKTGWLNQRY